MDKIYPPSDYECSERVRLQDCSKNWVEFYEENSSPYRDSIQGFFYINKKRMDEVERIWRTWIENANDPNDVVSEDADKFQKKQKDDEAYECELKPLKSSETNIELGTEFAVSIRVYYPFSSDGACNSFTKLRFSHEIVVLGSNTLADLRDKIMCVEVEHPNDDLSNVPSAKEKYPGFIFIENVFYNDMRNENAMDYSSVIDNWAQKVDLDLYSTAKMEETKINQLIIRFDYPYVYRHRGECEHIITFSIAWFLKDDSEPLHTSDYPYIKSVQRFLTKECILCYRAIAKWICYNSDRLPQAETFLCEQCVLEHMYKDGKKIGGFKLYPYYDESCPV